MARIYVPRIVDGELEDVLRSSGAVLIEGPKACGKTATARRHAASEVRLDVDDADRIAAEVAPDSLLDQPAPLLIDEWQVVPSLWNHVRRAVDDRHQPGQFILTGSATPPDDVRRHSGAGRFSVIQMRTMAMAETRTSAATVSLSALMNGQSQQARDPGVSVPDLAEVITRGGWPAFIGRDTSDVSRGLRDYLRQVSHVDVPTVTGKRRNPQKVAATIQSLARNTATEAAISTVAADTQQFGAAVERDAVREYLMALERLWVLEPQPAWAPAMRSRTQLRTSPKWHLADPSLAVAALRGSSAKLLRDIPTLGVLFESLVVHDLRVLSQPLDGAVYHFRDSKGLEVDAIVECGDGRWGAFEVKLGASRIDEAAETLLKFATKVDTSVIGEPSILAVVTATGPAYRRPDGVQVVPVATLGP